MKAGDCTSSGQHNVAAARGCGTDCVAKAAEGMVTRACLSPLGLRCGALCFGLLDGNRSVAGQKFS